MAYALVNNGTGTKHLDGTNQSFNLAALPSSGNLVIVPMAVGFVPTSVTDNKSNTFTRAVYVTKGGITAAIYYLRSPSTYTGTYTITVNGTGQTTCSGAIFSGTATTVDPKDQTSTNSGTSTTPTTAATGTNGANTSLGIICCGMEGYNPIWGFADPSGGGWTDMYFEIRNDSWWTGAGCYKLTSYAGVTLAAQQWTGSENSNWSAVAATFKDTGADSASAPPRRRVNAVFFD